MQITKDVELVLGTFVDLTTKTGISLNGSEICFVLAVDDFQEFIDKHTKSSSKDTVVLMRTKTSKDYAKLILEMIRDYKTPFNKKWYYRKPVSEILQLQGETVKYTRKLYKAKK